MLQWVSSSARDGHGFGKPGDFLDSTLFQLLKSDDRAAMDARNDVFRRLRVPGQSNGRPQNMPDMEGGLTLTRLQYEQFRLWNKGRFTADWAGGPKQPPLDQLPPEEQVTAIDQSSLFTAVGGSFRPGIEVGAVFGDPNTFHRPLRIDPTLAPGTLTRELSIPWQVDYSACGTGWWPAGRPNFVTKQGQSPNDTPVQWTRFSDPDDMLTAWYKLGFLVKSTSNGREVIVEDQRI